MLAYLAAQYCRRLELVGYATTLEAMGVDVNARWLAGHHEKPEGSEYYPYDRQVMADEDTEDLLEADTFITWTEPVGATGLMRGGRHVEFGIAWATGKRVIVVGHQENIFHHLKGVEYYATWPECLEAIRSSLKHGVKHGT